jgi:UDP-glucose:(heptosyl)LPS alpha-1,3-glucosyltransferase
MHYALAISEYFPLGGAQRDFFAVATALAARGHTISVITSVWQGERPAEWQCYTLDKQPLTNHGRMKVLSTKIGELKQQQGFDTVIGFSRLRHIDIFFAADGCFRARSLGGFKRYLPRYRHAAQTEQDVFANPALKSLFLTETQRQEYAVYADMNENNSVVIPVSVAQDYFYSEPTFEAARTWRRAEGVADDDIVLLMVAADFYTKGLDRIIAALTHCSAMEQTRFVLWIVGAGKIEQYQSKINKLTVRTKVWGGQTAVAKFYLAADCLLHPARKEAAGMVIAESLAARLPVCVSDVCGYAFLAAEDEKSAIIDQDNTVAELKHFLQQIAQGFVPNQRGAGSIYIGKQSRAEFCADQIEQWARAI